MKLLHFTTAPEYIGSYRKRNEETCVIDPDQVESMTSLGETVTILYMKNGTSYYINSSINEVTAKFTEATL